MKSISYIFWIFGCIFITMMFSNDILSRLITPQYESINSIQHLNQYKTSKTTIIYKQSFAWKNHLVITNLSLH